MLDPIGRSVSDFFRHLPAIFALDRTQSAVQIGHRSPPGFGPRKVPADPLSQRLKLLRPLLYGCCRRLRLSHCCYLSISKDSTSLSTTVGLDGTGCGGGRMRKADWVALGIAAGIMLVLVGYAWAITRH